MPEAQAKKNLRKFEWLIPALGHSVGQVEEYDLEDVNVGARVMNRVRAGLLRPLEGEVVPKLFTDAVADGARPDKARKAVEKK